MSRKIEFVVSECSKSSDVFTIGGICNLGTIAIDSVFNGAVRRGGAPHYNVALKVKKITAYRHDIDELPRGMSAELRCEGTVESEVMPKDLLTG